VCGVVSMLVDGALYVERCVGWRFMGNYASCMVLVSVNGSLYG